VVDSKVRIVLLHTWNKWCNYSVLIVHLRSVRGSSRSTRLVGALSRNRPDDFLQVKANFFREILFKATVVDFNKESTVENMNNRTCKSLEVMGQGKDIELLMVGEIVKKKTFTATVIL
jgi:hypothetical protein